MGVGRQQPPFTFRQDYWAGLRGVKVLLREYTEHLLRRFHLDPAKARHGDFASREVKGGGICGGRRQDLLAGSAELPVWLASGIAHICGGGSHNSSSSGDAGTR
jgi:hypothetical protein